MLDTQNIVRNFPEQFYVIIENLQDRLAKEIFFLS